MTFPAGIAAGQLSQKPLVIHVHSTEFDRSGENINQTVYDIERRGMHAANKIIAVSNYTKNIISSRYDVPAEKIEVVHNGVEYNGRVCQHTSNNNKLDKVVLFLGRITMQKGPNILLPQPKRCSKRLTTSNLLWQETGI